MILTAKRVSEILVDCLGHGVVVEGIIKNFSFNKEKLEKYSEEIGKLLDELPEQFKTTGDTSGNAAVDKHGNLWGQHTNIEELMCLGIGIGYAKMLLPRSMWPFCRGNMPPFQVNLNGKRPWEGKPSF